MDIEKIAKLSFGVGLMLNSIGLNKYINSMTMDKCSKINLHIGLSAFFISGTLNTYKALFR